MNILSTTAIGTAARHRVNQLGGRVPEDEIVSWLASTYSIDLDRIGRALSQERTNARLVRITKGGETLLVVPEDQRVAA
jgi:hypothetical protein